MNRTKILRVQVDIYVKVPGSTTNVAVEGTIKEGLDHGVHFLLGELAVEGPSEDIVWTAQRLEEGQVPKQVLDAWEEAEDLALEPEQP